MCEILLWVCPCCKIEFPLTNFYLRKGQIKPSGNCKKCEALRKRDYYKNNKDKEKLRFKKYIEKKPYILHLKWLRDRCNNPKDKNYNRYGGRGIKALITLNELETLWKRDKAEQMKHPSVDRIDGEKDYTFENCRFMELRENARKH
jgi:hypothetical protein